MASNLNICVFALILNELLKFGQITHVFDKLLMFWTLHAENKYLYKRLTRAHQIGTCYLI